MSISKYIFILLLAFSLGIIACSNTATSEKTNTTTAKSTASAPVKKSAPKKANTKPKQPLSDRGIDLILKTSKATKGTETCVDIVVKQFTDVVSMQYSLNWNPKELSYKTVKGFNLKDLSKGNFGANRTNEGKLSFSWFDQAIQGITVADNTSIYQVCFDAIGNSGDKSKVLITEDPVIVEITGKGGTFLKLFTETAYVDIQ